MITVKTIYQFNGKEFSSLNSLEIEIDNMLGKFVDTLCHSNSNFGIKHKLHIFDFLKKHRKELQKLYYEIENFEIIKDQSELI